MTKTRQERIFRHRAVKNRQQIKEVLFAVTKVGDSFEKRYNTFIIHGRAILEEKMMEEGAGPWRTILSRDV